MAARSHRSRRLARRVASGLLVRLARTADAIADRIEPSPTLRAWLQALSPAAAERSRPIVTPLPSEPPAHHRSHQQSNARRRSAAPTDWTHQDAEAATWDVREVSGAPPPAANETPPVPRTDGPASGAESVPPADAATPQAEVGDAALSLQIAGHLSQRVGPCIETLSAAAAWDDSTPTPEDLRSLRVASRRLRAFVVLFAPQVGNKAARRLNRRLRKITRALGPVRDGQAVVGLLQAAYHDADDPLERAALEHLLVQLRREQAPALHEGLAALRRARLRPLAEQLDDALQRVCGGLVRAGPQVHAYTWRALGPRADKLLAAVPARDLGGDDDALHEIRICAKRLRYTLEMVRPLLGPADATTRRIAKKVQRTLGEYRDATQLRGLMEARAQSLSAEGHATLARSLSQRAALLTPRCAAALTAAAPWVGRLDPGAIDEHLHAIFDLDPADPAAPSPDGDRPGQP